MFLENAPVHYESVVGRYSSIKLVHLPKNTDYRLIQLNADIIQNFNIKNQKELLCHVLDRFSNDCSVADVTKAFYILPAFTGAAAAWKGLSEVINRKCLTKRGILE